jgi:hypothetical protein
LCSALWTFINVQAVIEEALDLLAGSLAAGVSV